MNTDGSADGGKIQSSVAVDTNGTIVYAYLTDRQAKEQVGYANRKYGATLKVTNIDKVAPNTTAPTLIAATVNSLKIKVNQTDSQSGIPYTTAGKVEYSTDNGSTWKAFGANAINASTKEATITQLSANTSALNDGTEYQIRTRAKDATGNGWATTSATKMTTSKYTISYTKAGTQAAITSYSGPTTAKSGDTVTVTVSLKGNTGSWSPKDPGKTNGSKEGEQTKYTTTKYSNAFSQTGAKSVSTNTATKLVFVMGKSNVSIKMTGSSSSSVTQTKTWKKVQTGTTPKSGKASVNGYELYGYMSNSSNSASCHIYSDSGEPGLGATNTSGKGSIRMWKESDNTIWVSWTWNGSKKVGFSNCSYRIRWYLYADGAERINTWWNGDGQNNRRWYCFNYNV